MTVDSAFSDVIEACSRRDKGDEVWISDDIIAIYTQLYERGVVHSIETWHENELVGGLYGVAIGAAFFGESMFSVRSNASKAAFVYLLDHLQSQHFVLLDTQYLNRFTLQLGAVEIERAQYLELLDYAVSQTPRFSETDGERNEI